MILHLSIFIHTDDGIKVCFIWNHYKEAKECIHMLTAELAILKSKLNLTDNDFFHFLAKEHAYLLSLKQLLQQHKLKVHYVQALNDLEEKKYIFSV